MKLEKVGKLNSKAENSIASQRLCLLISGGEWGETPLGCECGTQSADEFLALVSCLLCVLPCFAVAAAAACVRPLCQVFHLEARRATPQTSTWVCLQMD